MRRRFNQKYIFGSFLYLFETLTKDNPKILMQSNFDFFIRIDDYAKDGGKELFTKMHCVL